MNTIQDQLKEQAKKCATKNELMQVVDNITREVINADNAFWGVEKRISGYGTWKAKINFINEYHYGRKIAEALLNDTGYIITHDEDRTFTMEDFKDKIEETVYELADWYWNDEDEEGEE